MRLSVKADLTMQLHVPSDTVSPARFKGLRAACAALAGRAPVHRSWGI